MRNAANPRSLIGMEKEEDRHRGYIYIYREREKEREREQEGRVKTIDKRYSRIFVRLLLRQLD